MTYPWAEEFLLSLPGVTTNFQPVWRWQRFYVGDKLFAVLCQDGEGRVVMITLKLPPEEGEALRARWSDVIPGYYMNKQHWNTVRVGGDTPEDVVRAALSRAWETGLRCLSRKKRLEIVPEEKEESPC